jgi:hypothetical protein
LTSFMDPRKRDSDLRATAGCSSRPKRQNARTQLGQALPGSFERLLHTGSIRSTGGLPRGFCPHVDAQELSRGSPGATVGGAGCFPSVRVPMKMQSVTASTAHWPRNAPEQPATAIGAMATKYQGVRFMREFSAGRSTPQCGRLRLHVSQITTSKCGEPTSTDEPAIRARKTDWIASHASFQVGVCTSAKRERKAILAFAIQSGVAVKAAIEAQCVGDLPLGRGS